MLGYFAFQKKKKKTRGLSNVSDPIIGAHRKAQKDSKEPTVQNNFIGGLEELG